MNPSLSKKPFSEEEDANILIASGKMKDAIGMKNGRITPNVLIVDAIEGIVGDSYVSGGTGTRQIKGVFHGTIVMGGRGAKSYLWKERLVRLILSDRSKSHMVVAAIGMGVPCLGTADLLESHEVAAPDHKAVLEALEKADAARNDDDITVMNRVITARDASAVEPFAQAIISAVEKTPFK